MNKMQNATPAFLIPLAVLPLQKKKKKIKNLCFALIRLALQNPSEDKAVIAFYAVQQTEVNPWWII